MYHSLFVTLWCVCYVIMWLLYHYLFAILSCVCYIINCLLYHQVFSISSSVCYIILCLLYYPMFVILSYVCYIILCLFYHPVFVILPHSVQLGNFSPAWNLAILQVGPRSGIIFRLVSTHPPDTARSELDYNHWGCV